MPYAQHAAGEGGGETDLLPLPLMPTAPGSPMGAAGES